MKINVDVSIGTIFQRDKLRETVGDLEHRLQEINEQLEWIDDQLVAGPPLRELNIIQAVLGAIHKEYGDEFFDLKEFNFNDRD